MWYTVFWFLACCVYLMVKKFMFFLFDLVSLFVCSVFSTCVLFSIR